MKPFENNNDNNNSKTTSSTNEVIIEEENIQNKNNINDIIYEKNEELINYSLNDLFDFNKIEIIKQNFSNKKIFCYECNEYTFINKLFKDKDDIDHKILVKFYCSESHEDHCFDLIEYLYNCCEEEIFESDISSYRNGQQMQLSSEELIQIKKDYKINI